MAADVDKIALENGTTSPHTGLRSPWISKGVWTLLLLVAVPLLAFGVKYYQDAQLLKRHVRATSVTTLHPPHSLAVFFIKML